MKRKNSPAVMVSGAGSSAGARATPMTLAPRWLLKSASRSAAGMERAVAVEGLAAVVHDPLGGGLGHGTAAQRVHRHHALVLAPQRIDDQGAPHHFGGLLHHALDVAEHRPVVQRLPVDAQPVP